MTTEDDRRQVAGIDAKLYEIQQTRRANGGTTEQKGVRNVDIENVEYAKDKIRCVEQQVDACDCEPLIGGPWRAIAAAESSIHPAMGGCCSQRLFAASRTGHFSDIAVVVKTLIALTFLQNAESRWL